jgi:hypothetical protein
MLDRDDVGIDVGEADADAQSEETIMPWIWGGLGLIMIAAFVGWVLVAAPHGHVPPNPPGAAPTIKPLNRGY